MAESRDRIEPRVRAILGPTNTGKTHRAIERMLAHRSGMIGLPLRLLAREVYDRVVERRGAESVALITGEEKRIPVDPQYWVCTVEAMPVDRWVSFLAVDEVQLAGDRNRGHTFTDRILNARGVEETLFLGAATIAPLLERLIPGITIETAPRLSKLSWAGSRKLGSVPPRSAVVAFSAEAVYEAAERLRGVHGGTAVVLGALSPRTRNAQVAMYQSGEVKHLVATDAIGMGLNMDIHHVAFAAVRKYDGRGHRALEPAELAQIAGRAGRYRTDGTFGTVRTAGNEPELPEDVIAAIEAHEFPPLQHLFWRNSALDLRSTATLLDSLREPPPFRGLVATFTEDDQQALETLSARDEIRDRVRGPDDVARLWEVCKVPDYHKTRTDAHVELLGQMAVHLLGGGVLPDGFVDKHVARLDRTDGDIETLMSRIAWIRTWTYVAWQRDWTGRPSHYQAWTRTIEDQLSDALHERLTARFVDRRVMLAVSPDAAPPVIVDGGQVSVGGVDVGRLRSFSFAPAGLPSRAAEAAVRRHLAAGIAPRIDALCASDDDAFTIEPDGSVAWDDAVVARLAAGPTALAPKVVVGRLDLLDPADRERVRVRLEAWRDGWVAGLFAPLDRPAAAKLSPAAKGLVYLVRVGLGTVDRTEEVEALIATLRADDRPNLAKLDVRIGAYTVYVQSLLRKEPMTIRATLHCLANGRTPIVAPPADGRPVIRPAGFGRELLAAIGYRTIGGLAVRVDTLEKVGAEVRQIARGPGPSTIDKLTSWLGANRQDTLNIVRGFGFRVRSRDDGRITLQRQRAAP
ncbi:MAG: helicase-related protein [Myxococcota bacterium]